MDEENEYIDEDYFDEDEYDDDDEYSGIQVIAERNIRTYVNDICRPTISNIARNKGPMTFKKYLLLSNAARCIRRADTLWMLSRSTIKFSIYSESSCTLSPLMLIGERNMCSIFRNFRNYMDACSPSKKVNIESIYGICDTTNQTNDIYERINNDMNYSIMRGIKSSNVYRRLEKEVLNYIIESLRTHLYADYTFYDKSDTACYIDVVQKKFICRYDKKYKEHLTTIAKNEKSIVNKRFITRLNKYTFMYVATGNKITSDIFSPIDYRVRGNREFDKRDMYICIIGKDWKKYAKQIESIIKKEADEEYSLGIYNVDARTNNFGPYDNNKETLSIIYSPLKTRNMDTLFYSDNEINTVCRHIDKFKSLGKFYEKRSILYKTGILLYGSPGTGKSTFVKAIASKYKMDIININVNNIKAIDLTKIAESINADTENDGYIVLLEDIDTLFLNREDSKTDAEGRKVINKLLQFLDSNTSPNNVVFIATTNHKERLDDALLRGGRFDIKVNIRALKKKDAIRFGKSFNISDSTIQEILDNMDIEANTNGSEDNTEFRYNQSELQVRFLAKIENRCLEDSMRIHCDEVSDDNE